MSWLKDILDSLIGPHDECELNPNLISIKPCEGAKYWDGKFNPDCPLCAETAQQEDKGE